MRPVERGAAPREYARYGDAIDDLEERLGRYCSYCERRLPIGLAVEHMAPKSLHPDREVDWDNFLLGCTNCNSVKDVADVADGDILWPDRHNTMLAVAYSRGGFVRLAGRTDSRAAEARTGADRSCGIGQTYRGSGAAAGQERSTLEGSRRGVGERRDVSRKFRGTRQVRGGSRSCTRSREGVRFLLRLVRCLRAAHRRQIGIGRRISRHRDIMLRSGCESRQSTRRRDIAGAPAAGHCPRAGS